MNARLVTIIKMFGNHTRPNASRSSLKTDGGTEASSKK